MRTRGAACALGLLVVLTGCGGHAKSVLPTVATPSAKATPTKPRTPKAAVSKAVKAYSLSLIAGKGKHAFPMLSVRCRKVIGASSFNALAAQAHRTYPHVKLTKVTVNDLKGTKAHVSYTYSAAVLNQKKESWIKEHGAWRWNGC